MVGLRQTGQRHTSFQYMVRSCYPCNIKPLSAKKIFVYSSVALWHLEAQFSTHLHHLSLVGNARCVMRLA